MAQRMIRLQARKGVTMACVDGEQYVVTDGTVLVPESAVADLTGPVHKFVRLPEATAKVLNNIANMKRKG